MSTMRYTAFKTLTAKHDVVRQGAWGRKLSIPTSAAATEDTPTQIALASLISSQLLSLPGTSVAPAADDRDSVTSTSTLAALRMTPAVRSASVPVLAAGEHAIPCGTSPEVPSDPVLTIHNVCARILAGRAACLYSLDCLIICVCAVNKHDGQEISIVSLLALRRW